LKVFKGALIGCGFFSQHHQAAWSRIPNAEIVAACDLSIDRARAAAPRAYASVEEMLKVEELDFVDIATRSTTHLELVSMAAKRGLAIICQKPMAPDWETARRMVEIAESHDVRVMIHDNW
jgi:D-apiose dehydrogenase